MKEVPKFLSTQDWEAGYMAVTTPASNGKILTTGKTPKGDSTLSLDYPLGATGLPDPIYQLWKAQDVSKGECFYECSGNVVSPHAGSNGHYINTSTGGNSYYLGDYSHEQDHYDPTTGKWCHWNNNCGWGVKNPTEKSWVCAADGAGTNGIGVYATPSGGEPNIPDCKWISWDTARICCMTDPSEVQSKYLDQCSPSYVPGVAGSSCPLVMASYCENYWNDTDPTIKQQCNQYFSLTNWQRNKKQVSDASRYLIANYIGSMQQQGYIKSRDGTPSGTNYSFYTQVLPQLCSLGECDDILDYYCKGFSREDLQDDSVLQSICGCHLSGDGGNPSNPPNTSPAKQIYIPDAIASNQYPYGSVSCDPVCNLSDVIQNYSTSACQQTECVIDNINVNQINSSGDVNFNLVCNSCSGVGSKGCSCYVSSDVVDQIQTNGKATLKANCGDCFVFTGDISHSQKVDCSTLSGSTGGGGNSFIDFLKNKSVIGGLVLWTVLIGSMIGILVFKKYKKT